MRLPALVNFTGRITYDSNLGVLMRRAVHTLRLLSFVYASAQRRLDVVSRLYHSNSERRFIGAKEQPPESPIELFADSAVQRPSEPLN